MVLLPLHAPIRMWLLMLHLSAGLQRHRLDVLLVVLRGPMTGIAVELAARDSVGRACAAPDTLQSGGGAGDAYRTHSSMCNVQWAWHTGTHRSDQQDSWHVPQAPSHRSDWYTMPAFGTMPACLPYRAMPTLPTRRL